MDQTGEQALEELGGKLERMNAALANIGEAIAWTDSKGSLQWCNTTFCQLTGVRQEEVLNRPLAKALPLYINGRHLSSDEHPIHKALGGSESPSEIYGFRLDGRTLALEVSATKFHFEKSGGTCAVLTARDITARQTAEKKLQLTNQSRIDMMASVSHEIRNAMLGIIGMTDLALASPVTIEQRDYLGMVVEAAQSLLDDFGNMLDLSELEAGRLTLNNLPLDLDALLQEIESRHTPSAKDRGIALEVTGWHNAPGMVMADRKRLAQVLNELVGNAIAATESGSVHLEVTSEEQSKTLAHLRFEVRDTGAGLPQDIIDQLFDSTPLIPAVGAEPRPHQIHGLLLTKKLVDLMGGQLRVTSPEGHGTTFEVMVCLPLDQGSSHGDRPIGVHVSPAGQATTASEHDSLAPAPRPISKEAEEFSPAVNTATIATLRELGDSSEFLSSLVSQYLSDTRQRLGTLLTAISSADVEVIEHTANSLKSSSASMGADRMAQVGSKLETLGRTKSIEGAQGLLEQASGEFEKVRQELKQILSEPGS